MKETDQHDVDWAEMGVKIRSALAVLISLGVLLGGAWFVYSKVHDTYVAYKTRDDYPDGEAKEAVSVVIPKGASVTQIGDILVEQGVIKSRKAFREEATANTKSSSIQAGRYKLLTHIPAEKALAMLLDPKNIDRLRVQIKEGQTIQQQWAAMKEKVNLDQKKFEAGMPEAAKKLPKWAGGKLEGFLFPDTYEVQEPARADQIMGRQIDQFKKVAADLHFEDAAKARKLTPLQLLTVASIIEREAGSDKDRALVASVIYNRLDKKMKLQMDSTVNFAVNRYTSVTTTDEERNSDSPYNTYKHQGLPPGPICSPGKASMEAAMNPETSDYMYFVVVDLDKKETKFAKTIEEHDENVKQFQQWCQAHKGRC